MQLHNAVVMTWRSSRMPRLADARLADARLADARLADARLADARLADALARRHSGGSRTLTARFKMRGG